MNSSKYKLLTRENLAECDGTNPRNPIYVAIMGTIFDVSGNHAYAREGAYHIFAGKDASRALALSSLKPEDCKPDYEDLGEKEKAVLRDWLSFFTNKYKIIGRVHKKSR